MRQKTILLLLSIFLITTAFATPPPPPEGMRWVRNEKFSDEFNGTELDATKWYDYHPNWAGRVPGIFLPSQVKVADGYMNIRGEKLKKDTVITNKWSGNTYTYNIACGAVISKSQEAFFGYYECRFKASPSTLSTTFWLSTRKNTDGPEACADTYQLELDIQECIGREGDFDGSWFAKGMHSNGHFWYTDCDKVNHDYRAPDVRFPSPDLPSKDFNTYGGWWKNAKEASFYYNNNLDAPKNMKFYDKVKSEPFDQPMGVNMVAETYPFPWIELPKDEALADPERSTCYYDWVRCYTLVDVNTEVIPEVIPPIGTTKNGDVETGDLTGWGGWGVPREVVAEAGTDNSYAIRVTGAGAVNQKLEVKPNTEYVITADVKIVSGTVILGAKETVNAKEVTLGSLTCSNNSYEKKTITVTSSSSGAIQIYFYAIKATDSGFIDNLELKETNPVIVEPKPKPIVQLYTENISVKESELQLATEKTQNIPFTYMANQDREIHLVLSKIDKTVVADTVFTAYAGYGNALSSLQLPTELTAGDYILEANIRPTGGDDASILSSQNIVLKGASLGVNNGANSNVVSIYPNPVRSQINVRSNATVTNYSIYTLSGAQVQQGNIQNKQINVDNLPQGTYVLKVDKSESIQFIKQ